MRKLIIIVVLAWAAVSLFSAYSSVNEQRPEQTTASIPG
jgi:hypothetical protein